MQCNSATCLLNLPVAFSVWNTFDQKWLKQRLFEIIKL